MIDNVIRLLNLDPFYGQSELIDIAKGKNKLPMNLVEGWEAVKRDRKWRKR